MCSPGKVRFLKPAESLTAVFRIFPEIAERAEDLVENNKNKRKNHQSITRKTSRYKLTQTYSEKNSIYILKTSSLHFRLEHPSAALLKFQLGRANNILLKNIFKINIFMMLFY